MNKEEMLNLLEKLQDKIADSKVSEYGIDDKVAIIEELIRLKDRKEAEIKYLTEKLSNDDNYIDRTPYLYDESRRFNLEDYLEARVKEEEENISNIHYYEELISQMERTLPTQEETSRKIVAELEEELADMQADLRDSANMTEEEFNALRDQIAEKRTLRDAYSENITNGRISLENARKRLEELKANSESLTDARVEAEEILAGFDKRIEDRPLIDLEAKRADERQLMINKAELKAYDARERYASFDYEKELSEIVALYRADKISQEEVVERIKNYKNFIAEDFLTGDIAQRQENPELEEIKQARIACSDEIARLETKLSDDNNYAVSLFVVERRARELKRLDGRIKNIEQQIADYNKEMNDIQVDIETSESMIAQLQLEKREIEKNIRRAGANIDPEYEKQLLADIASKEQDIEYLQSVKIDCSRTLEHDATELELLESKNERYKTIYSRLEKNYERRNKIDFTSKRLDEQKLAKLKAGMEALNRREEYISVSLEEELDNIINANLSKASDNNSSPIDEETEDLNDILNGMEDFSTVKKNNTGTPAENGEKADQEKENFDPLNLGDTRGFKAKFSEHENEKLAKKAKKIGFVQKLKKWFKRILLVASLVLVIAGLKKCSQLSIDNYMAKVQEDPTRIENMTEDELKDDIEDNVVVVEQEKEVEESEKVEESETVENEKTTEKKELDKKEKESETVENEKTAEKKELDKKEKESLESKNLGEVEQKTTLENDKNVQQETTVVSDNGNVNVDVTDGISMEEQEQILRDQGIIPSQDVAPQIIVDDPTYDYDFTDEKAYGTFTEGEVQSSPEVETPEVKVDTPEVSDDWGEFTETGIVTPEATDNSKDEVLNIPVNNGESFVYNAGDGTIYEYNNGAGITFSDEEFVELPDATVTQNTNGDASLQVSGETLENMEREESLTAADLQRIRDELAAQFGGEAVTQQEVDEVNAEFRRKK